METIAMNHITLLIKPASSLCNMRCSYCFYEDLASSRSRKSLGIMSPETTGTLIRKVFDALSQDGSVSFLFQGGEPTLAGLDYFQHFVDTVETCRRRSNPVYYAIQTNGLLVDAKFAEFFARHRFLAGLSVDGTQLLHDRFRRDAAGKGTWQQAADAFHLLQKYRVETSLLCVVTAQTAKKASQVYRSLTALGARSLQFIPCLEPLDAPRGKAGYALTPDAYGRFLCQLFDCWYQDWKAGKQIRIRTFDDYLSHMLRLPPSSCAASGKCGSYLVAEGDGSLYPCDFYVLDRWCLGNIHSCGIRDALCGPKAAEFLAERGSPSAECTRCRYYLLCRGGCKRDWDSRGGNYYCSSYKTFLPYAIPRMEEMAAVYARYR